MGNVQLLHAQVHRNAIGLRHSRPITPGSPGELIEAADRGDEGVTRRALGMGGELVPYDRKVAFNIFVIRHRHAERARSSVE